MSAPQKEITMDSGAYKVSDGSNFALSDHPTRVHVYKNKAAARAACKADAKLISKLSHRLYGESKRSLLVVLQGMDTSGKDGTTSAIFAYTPPLNVTVAAFKGPSKEELSHDFLWRVHKVCPAKGQITVFNRSHYEDVLIAKVREFASPEMIDDRYAQINDFEKLLIQNGTVVLKFMLNISHETQGERLRERLEVADKRWKFNPSDLDDRSLWPDFMAAYETMVSRCTTADAPWHIIPSDSRTTRKAIITRIVRETLEAMDPHYPDPGYRPEDYQID